MSTVRVRSGSLLLALTTLLAACSPPAAEPEVIAELRDYDEAFANIERGMKPRLGPLSDEKDFRGKRYEEELAQWVLTPETRTLLGELRRRAAAATNMSATHRYLGEARSLLAADANRAAWISAYWRDALPAPYWRNYWNALYIANEEPVASPDPLLLSIEARMREALNRGEFQNAAEEAQMMPPALGEALNRAAGNLVKSRKNKMKFVARRTECQPGLPPDRASGRPRIKPNDLIDSFYPPDAKRINVEGTVVLSARVDGDGCAKQVAIVVRSGVPTLDQGALDWVETAQFAPAWQGGRTITSELRFKVRFRIEQSPDPHSSREDGPE